jgi:transposase-like protein
MTHISYAGYRLPPDVIRYSVWLNYRFSLNPRMVEEWLAARGIDLKYETVRRWSVNIGLCIDRHTRSTAPVDLQLLRADTYLERHVKPVAFYNERASVFHVKKREETLARTSPS